MTADLGRQSYLAYQHARRAMRQSSPRRVYAILRSGIRRGYYPGGHVFVESELMRQLSATRAAVRTALQMLAHDGLVSRHAGGGTLLQDVITSIPIGRPGPIWERNPYRTASVERLDRNVLPASGLLAQCLQVPAGAPIVMLEYLVRQDGVASSVIVSYVHPAFAVDGPAEPVPPAVIAPDGELPLLPHLRGVEIGSADVYVEAVPCEERTSRLLGIPAGAPVLQRDILLHHPSGAPVELAFAQYRGDRSALYASGPGVAVHGDTRHQPQSLRFSRKVL
jgi:GntR family transcriptional regulator